LLNRTVTSRLAIALAAPAFALTALAASGGLSTSAAAQPVRSMQTSSLATTDSALHISAQSTVAHSSATQLTHTTRHKRHKRLTPKQIAWKIMHWFHWKPKWQFRYLNKLWMRESSWNVHAANPYSGAYGIPQAVPGSKMGSVAKNWRNSPKTQIRWGMRYIKAVYGSPKHAWIHEIDDGWY
jgi:hypothetical protein